ncbi:MAG: sigma-70 family RNA polymerase sigma factor [Planctomycetes bacterium]|nr:sigma-70 family RNA polymerase sigma factor [Planctomycetota bacterium]
MVATRVKNRTQATGKSSTDARQGIDPNQMRFVPDRRLGLPRSVDKTLAVVDWITGSRTDGDAPGETCLFISMHVCAYQATRRSKKAKSERKARSERQDWVRRWDIIRSYIVEQNIGLTYTMMSQFRATQVEWDEQRSEALYALLRAVDGFNPWKGFRFSTYACNAITRALIHLWKKTSRQQSRFPVEHEAWMEKFESEDKWTSLYADRLHKALDQNLGELTPRESMILWWRFPLDGQKGLTLGQIGEAIGLSKERARQIQEIALEKLRGVLKSDPALQ